MVFLEDIAIIIKSTTINESMPIHNGREIVNTTQATGYCGLINTLVDISTDIVVKQTGQAGFWPTVDIHISFHSFLLLHRVSDIRSTVLSS